MTYGANFVRVVVAKCINMHVKFQVTDYCQGDFFNRIVGKSTQKCYEPDVTIDTFIEADFKL